MNRKQLSAICGVAAALFALFVWPTFYRYEHQGPRLVRINRLTGSAAWVQPQDARTEPTQAAAPAEKQPETLEEMRTRQRAWYTQAELPPEAVRLLAVQCGKSDAAYAVGHAGMLECSLYNGSDWTVTSVTLSNKGREYVESNAGIFGPFPAKPKSVIRFGFDPGIGMPSSGYSVTAATGQPPPKPAP